MEEELNKLKDRIEQLEHKELSGRLDNLEKKKSGFRYFRLYGVSIPLLVALLGFIGTYLTDVLTRNANIDAQLQEQIHERKQLAKQAENSLIYKVIETSESSIEKVENLELLAGLNLLSKPTRDSIYQSLSDIIVTANNEVLFINGSMLRMLDPEELYEISVSLDAQGKKTKALIVAELASYQGPTNYNYLTHLAKLYLDLRIFGKAAESYITAFNIGIESDEAWNYYNCARAYIGLNNKKMAYYYADLCQNEAERFKNQYMINLIAEFIAKNNLNE